MKIPILIARILLGFAFFAGGLNHIVNPHPQTMPGDAGAFVTLLIASRYMVIVALIETIGGLLLLVGRFVPLALTLLGPIIVNILLFALLLAHSGVAVGISLFQVVLELFLIWAYRFSFRGLFDAAPEVY